MLSLPIGSVSAANSSAALYTGSSRCAPSSTSTVAQMADMEENINQEDMNHDTSAGVEIHESAEETEPSIMEEECERDELTDMADNIGVSDHVKMEDEDTEYHQSIHSPPNESSRDIQHKFPLSPSSNSIQVHHNFSSSPIDNSREVNYNISSPPAESYIEVPQNLSSSPTDNSRDVHQNFSSHPTEISREVLQNISSNQAENYREVHQSFSLSPRDNSREIHHSFSLSPRDNSREIVHHNFSSPLIGLSRVTPVSTSQLLAPSSFVSDMDDDDDEMEEKSREDAGMSSGMEEAGGMEGEGMEDDNDPASNILMKLMLSARLGKLLESLKNNNTGGVSDEERGEPPTPPHTPQRDGPPGSFLEGGLPRPMPPLHALDPLQQHHLHQRMLLGGGNLQSLLQLAALQEGKTLGVPLPPTLDAHRASSTPTTPTSTVVNSGLAGLSLGFNSPTLLQGGLGSGLMGMRDSITKPNIDYTRYVTPFSSALECGNASCREHNLREHFHCIECSKVFSKKEEMIRHFKWHKKRDESLQHGFMRYSPQDDCSDRFLNCSHNSKQTHYHCLKDGCDKVYISTSDVQMHANYHRKDSAIMQEGFQRFRATENCGIPTCAFSGQRTTHFHCIRAPCNYTFKNKADMEKHKSYHIKDEQLSKDGFKKFMKNEECPYDGCKFSRVVNHIHCIRQECNYVLHSSGQILAHKVSGQTFTHKRKHDRQDHERAYRKYKLAQTYLGVPDGHPALSPLLHDAMRMGSPLPGSLGPPDFREEDSSSPLGPPSTPGTPIPHIHPGVPRPMAPNILMGQFTLPPVPPGVESQQAALARLLSIYPPQAHGMFPGSSVTSTTSTPVSTSSGPSSPVDLSVGVGMTGGGDDRDWEKWVRCHQPEDTCRTGCELSGVEHWHCDECETVFRGHETARDHGRIHEQQAIVTEEHYTRILGGEERPPCSPNCPMKNVEHYHCNWESCGEVIPESVDKPFRRLEHFRMHDYARRVPLGGPGSNSQLGMPSIMSIDAMFKRKRGRPPKNMMIEVWNDYLPVSSGHDSPQAIFTSFKLPKSSPPSLHHLSMQMGQPVGQHMIPQVRPPPMSPLGHLANMGRDGHVTPPGVNIPINSPGDRVPFNIVFLPLNGPVTMNPPQPQAEINNGFYSWAEGGPCPDQLCPLIGRHHFHCAHPRCLYVTAHADVLPLHAHDFHENMPISEGFIAIDRNINCRAPTCQSNKVNKHFHCIRCGYSFVRYQAMESHAEKHQQEDEAINRHSLGPVSPIYLKKPSSHDSTMESPTSSTESPIKGQDLSPPVVKSAGTWTPLSPFPITPTNSNQSAMRLANPRGSEPGALVTAIPPSSRPQPTTTFTLPVSGNLTITRQSPHHFSPPKFEKMEDDEREGNNNHTNEHPNEMSHPPLTEQQAAVTAAMLVGSSWLSQEKHPQYSAENSCGRPFCKLKKKEHFHCYICNQAFSEHEKLRPHLLKHAAGGPLMMSEDGEGEEDNKQNEENRGPIFVKAENSDHPFSPRSPNSTSDSSMCGSGMATSSTSPCLPTSGPQIISPAGPQIGAHFSLAASIPGFPPPFGPQLGFPGYLPRMLPPGAWPGVHPALAAAMAQQGLILPSIRPNGDLPNSTSPGHPGLPGIHPPGIGGDSNPLLPASLMASNLGLFGKRLGDNDLMMSQEQKKMRSNQHAIRMLKDEPIPEGYVRFRFNEDCQYPHCGYREHQTHFHCMRKDCGYSFCDKTRFVQHTARHERLDTLMGGDFHQFRSNVSCGRQDCVYASMIGQQQNKASHFHCLKCEFVCTDTNKVVAHRRQHQKRDSINAAGFEKFTPSQPCGVQGCNHNQKQTHYHCLKCHYSVLGLSQMSAHRFRHLD